MNQNLHRPLLLLALCVCAAQPLYAEDLFLADGNAFPGKLWRSDAGTAEGVIHQREARANAAYPTAITKLAQVAVGPDDKIYFCSGLDGYVMHLLEGRHEIKSFDIAGQIRDLACTGEEHTVYYSVVPTPQNGERLADGKIYRRDLWEGSPSEVATIHQADVGGNWWGAFTIKDGFIYLSTIEDRSRIFKLTSNGPEQVFADCRYKIQGLSAGPDGDFYFTTGGANVYRTSNFVDAEVALRTERRLTDVNLRASAEAVRP